MAEVLFDIDNCGKIVTSVLSYKQFRRAMDVINSAVTNMKRLMQERMQWNLKLILKIC